MCLPELSLRWNSILPTTPLAVLTVQQGLTPGLQVAAQPVRQGEPVAVLDVELHAGLATGRHGALGLAPWGRGLAFAGPAGDAPVLWAGDGGTGMIWCERRGPLQ